MAETIYIKKKEKYEIYQTAADIIEKELVDLAVEKDDIVLALPGGRSMPGIYEELIKRDIPWEKVHIFMVDDRMVPIDHEHSNFRLANESLIKKIGIPKTNVHPFVVGDDEEDSLALYEKELKSLGGAFDLVVLSSGEDGHIAALYPNHHSISDEEGLFIGMHDSPKMPKDRMSSSTSLLTKSGICLLLFSGQQKKEAFERFMDPDIEFSDCPAKLAKIIEKSYVLTDIE